MIIKVTQMLKKEGIHVKLGIGTNLLGMPANKYGVIIIINFIDDKSKDRSVEVFADESVQKKIVLLNAIGDYLVSDKDQASSKIAFDIFEKAKIILLTK